MSALTDVIPTESELAEFKDEHQCPECVKIFKKSSHLSMHLVKHHKIGKMPVKILSLRYFCPIDDCAYNVNSPKKKCFNERRLLKQHYMKVHGQKKHTCEKCEAKFSILSVYKRHLNTCGVKYVCEVCFWEYDCKDSLVVHLLRKHPDVHTLYKMKKTQLLQKADTRISSDNRNAMNESIIQHGEVKNSKKTVVLNKNFSSDLEVDFLVNEVKDAVEKSIAVNLEDNRRSKLHSTDCINESYTVEIIKNVKIENDLSVVCVPTYFVVPGVAVYNKTHRKSKDSLVLTETDTSVLPTINQTNKIKNKSVRKPKKIRLKNMKESCVNSDSVPEESVTSTFNQDQFTQTTLKIVKKSNGKLTEKFNAETQTLTSNGTLKPKMKADKSTNSSQNNSKRTLATQTNRSVLNSFKNVDNDQMNKFKRKKDDVKTTHFNKKILQKLSINDSANSANISSNKSIDFINSFEASTLSVEKVAAIPNNKYISCDLNNISPSHFDSQYIYRDLIDDKCAGSSSTIETQTALDELLYSNRWKHDSILFSELICLSDIQTQTAWPTENNLSFDSDNCLNSLSDAIKYPECENASASAETQTNEKILGFTSKVSPFEDNRNDSPDFSFKETQTCDCFMDSINYSDYEYANLASGSYVSTNKHAKDCCRVLLNRKSDVLLSCTSSETQTYLEDQNINSNLSNEIP